MASATPRQTKLQTVTSGVAELEESVKWIRENESEWASEKGRGIHRHTVELEQRLKKDMSGLVKKASEADPDKRTYSQAMSEKILLLNKAFLASSEEFDKHSARIIAATQENEKREKAAALAALEREQAAEKQRIIASEQLMAAASTNETTTMNSSAHQSGQSAQADDQNRELQIDSASPRGPESIDQKTVPAEISPQKTAVEKESSGKEGPSQSKSETQGLVTADTPLASALPREDSESVPSQKKPEPPARQPVESYPGSEPTSSVETINTTHTAQKASSSQQSLSQADTESLQRLTAMKARWEKEGQGSILKSAMDLLEQSPQNLTNGGQELMQILQAAETSGTSVLVDFSASWCGPCRAMKPVLVQLAEEFRGRICVVQIDTEETQANRSLASEAAVRAFPTFHIYFGRSRKTTFQGGKPIGALRSMLEKHIEEYHSPAVKAGKPKDSKKDQMSQIIDGIQGVKTHTSFDKYQEFCRLLQKILENIRDNPQDPKYRSLKASNKKFQEAILSLANARGVLQRIGFYPLIEGGAEVFYGTDVQTDVLNDCLELLPETVHSTAFSKFIADLSQPSKEVQAEEKVQESNPPPVQSALPAGSSDPVQLAQTLAQLLRMAPGASGPNAGNKGLNRGS